MELTLDQIKEAVKNNPELRKGLVGVVAETDEGKELLTNHATAHFNANIGTKVSEIYTNIDNDISETLGIKKPADKKTYDFLKEVLADFKKIKESKGNDSEKQAEIDELKRKVKEFEKDPNNSKHWHDTYNEALKKFEEKEKEYQDKLTGLEKASQESLVKNDLSTGLSGLKINPQFPQDVVDVMKNNVMEQVMKNSKIIDGKVQYMKEDGTPWLDKEYKPITAQGIFAEKMSSVLQTEKTPGGGAQTGKAGEIITVGEGESQAKKVVLDRTKFNTKLEFHNVLEKTLIEQSVERGSKEWAELRDNAAKEYEVDKLERA